MAEVTLANVTKTLADSNRDQVKAQKDTTAAVSALTKSMEQFLLDAEAARLKQLERDREAQNRARQAAAATPVSSGGGGGDGLGLGRLALAIPGGALLAGVGGALAGITGALGGFVAATEGLGPNMADLGRFKKAVTGYSGFLKSATGIFKLPEWAKAADDGKLNVFDKTPANIKKVEKIIGDRFKFDAKSARWKAIGSTKYSKFDDVAKYVEDMLAQVKKADDALPEVKQSNALKLALKEGGWLSNMKAALTDNKFIKGFLKVLRPIAVILSVFDGVENAQKELEDREGKFDKFIGGGLGGFLSGTLASFFGEMLDFIKAIPTYIIKQFVPAEWLNADGTFNDTNAFTSFMATYDDFSFTNIIKDIIQYPFDVLGQSLDFVRNLFGATGTTAEGQAEAQKQWDEWWSMSPLNMGKSILGTLANIVFSPINAIINEVKRVLGIDDGGEGKNFVENIRTFVEYLYGLIPSIEDIKRNLAMSLPEVVARGIGLGDYLPVDDAAYMQKMGKLQERIAENRQLTIGAQSLVRRAQEGDPTLQGNDFYAVDAAQRFLAAQEERNAMLLEEMATINQSAREAGINTTTINNTSQQIETMMFPNGGASDPNDLLIQ